MQRGLSNSIRVSLGVLFVLCTCLSALAEEPQLDELASQMATSLSQSKQKSVAVFAFVGADETEVLGQKLADDFHVALVRAAHGFRVEDRSQLLAILGKTSALSASTDDADTASWFLRESGVDASILGTVSNESSGLRVSVRAVRVRDSHQISNFETLVPLTDDLKALIGKSARREFAGWPRGGKNGYSSPICLDCPRAQYFGPPLPHRIDGTVVLEISVGEDGHASHIRIKKAMLYGMTESAVETVQKWRFKPATGPDGKAAAVRETVEMTFHLY